MAIKSLIFLYFLGGFSDLRQDWCFHKGKEIGINVEVQYALDCEKINLPHRVLEPNTALWYTKTMDIDMESYLQVKADDGAQVYQDGKRVLSIEGNFFPLSKCQNSKITIRVLNNAMKGGLNSVTFYNKLPTPTVKSSNTPKFIAAQNHSKQPKLKNKEVMTFSFWGDSQSGWPIFEKISAQLLNNKDDFSIGLGDFVNNGYNQREWEKFILHNEELSKETPIYTIPGNHDYDGYYDDLLPKNYYQFTSTSLDNPTYHSFKVGNSFFIALDPNRNFPIGIDDQQTSWLKKQINSKSFKKSKWKFLLIHQPPYAQGWEGYEGELFVRSLMTEHHLDKIVDFVLSGHNHDYERLIHRNADHQIAYVIAGGAGGGMEEKEISTNFVMDKIIKKHHFCRLFISKNQAKLIAYDLEGKEIDNFEVIKR